MPVGLAVLMRPDVQLERLVLARLQDLLRDGPVGARDHDQGPQLAGHVLDVL